MILPRILPSTTLLVALLPLARGAEASPNQPPANPAFSVKHMDLSVSPREDFAKFAAGGWYGRTSIPSDKSRWGGMDELAERNWANVRRIVEEAAAAPGAAGSNTQKVGDFFASAMDVARINALGTKPIEADLAAIAAVKDLDGLMELTARMHLQLGNPFFTVAFFPDQKKSDTYGFYLFQGGLSLPSKDYYFSEKFALERWEFVGHVAKTLELAGTTKAEAYRQAEIVLSLEKALAENAKLPVELRDRLANYNKMSIAEAVQAYAGLPLPRYLSALGLPASVKDVIVGQPKFCEGLAKLLPARPLEEWKTYVR